MIKLEKVTKLYNTNGSVAIGIQNIDLELSQGEIVVIVGDSGAGKTTLMNVITGIDTYEEGEMYLDDKSTSDYSKEDFEKFRNENVGFIFQNYNLIESYSVLDNVMAPLLARGFDYKEAKERAKKIIEDVGLKHRMNTRSNKLSGGEKQRCVIARALVVDSKILACDEPTGNLDSKTGKEIISLIHKFSKDKLVLIVTHDYESFKDIATRRLTIKDGHLVEDVKLSNKENTISKLKSEEKKKIKPKSYLSLALKNVIASPKRSIFSCLVLLIQFFIVLFLVITVVNFDLTYEKEVIQYSSYTVKDSKTLISYPSNNQDYLEILNDDAKSFDDTYDFFECDFNLIPSEFLEGMTDENSSSSQIPSVNNENVYVFNRGYKIRPYFEEEKRQVLLGQTTLSDFEIILAYKSPQSLNNSYLSSINRNVNLAIYRQVNDSLGKKTHYLFQDIKIVGFVYDPSLNNDYIIMSENTIRSLQEEYKGKLDLVSSLFHGYFSQHAELTTNMSRGGRYQNHACNGKNSYWYAELVNQQVLSNFNIEENTIYIDSSIDKDEFFIGYKKYIFDLSSYKIDNTQRLRVGDTFIYILPESFVDLFFNNVYQVRTFYHSEKALNEDFKKANNNNLYSEVTIDLVEERLVTDFSFVGALFSLAFLLIILVLSIFIGRIVLSFVYGSKKNDYAIFKVLGFNEKSIRIIDALEIAIVSIITFILDVVMLLLVIHYTGMKTINSPEKNPIFYIVCFILVMFIALDFIRRFENKVFRKSIASTLKAGDYLD